MNWYKTVRNTLNAALLLVVSASCQENKFGVVDLSIEVPKVEDKDYIGEGLKHPCMLLTNDDFEYIKQQIAKDGSIQKKAYAHMTRSENTYAQTNYAASPVKRLGRLDNTNWGRYNERWASIGYTEEDYNALGSAPHANYMNFSRDCAAALAQAVLYKITGTEAYAQTASKILNAWANTCEGYVVDKKGDFIDPNENLIALEIYQIANAAELMRDYPAFNLSKFKKWIVDVFYPYNHSFIAHEGQSCPTHAWFNWDLANLTAILSIGILTDDNAKINEALNYYKYTGKGSGYIGNAIPFIHQDPDSSEKLSQCQESGRDQGHTSLCCGMLAIFCKMASNVGENLLAYDDYSALGMFEYYAKYNVGAGENKKNGKSWVMNRFHYAPASVPFTTLTKCTNSGTQSWSELSYEEKKNGDDTRGTVNPSWELICRMAEDAGQSHIYSAKFREVMRQNADRGYCDGGAGDYGPDSGGFDIFGWGSLLYAKEAEE